MGDADVSLEQVCPRQWSVRKKKEKKPRLSTGRRAQLEAPRHKSFSQVPPAGLRSPFKTMELLLAQSAVWAGIGCRMARQLGHDGSTSSRIDRLWHLQVYTVDVSYKLCIPLGPGRLKETRPSSRCA